MNSQLRFVMHPDDEREFAAQVLADPAVLLIDGPRWPAAAPQTFRSLDAIRSNYCILWSPEDRASLEARYIAGCNDWYCASEDATVQFLRSELFADGVLTEGRIAVATGNASAQAAQGVERHYKALGRFVRKHYRNAVLRWCNPAMPFGPAVPGRSANPGKPDAQVWVGPHALQWLRDGSAQQLRTIKQSRNAVVEARLADSFTTAA